MAKVRLVHWKPEEAQEGVKLLIDAGLEVLADTVAVPNFLRELENERPDAVLIDLSRAPSQGRDLAIALRMRKGTRSIPIIFVAGKAEKVQKIRDLLPDAGYTDWESAAMAVKTAIRAGVKDPIVPESVFAAYAGKPLAEKLGIKADFIVACVGAPDDFEATLGKLPSAATVIAGPDINADLTIWFTLKEENLRKDLASIIAASKTAPVWIAWPKRGSTIKSDLTQQTVRKIGMAEGMVDYKVCSIDADWSALLFTWRGKKE
jgi:CheY-like chemotaxis protein